MQHVVNTPADSGHCGKPTPTRHMPLGLENLPAEGRAGYSTPDRIPHRWVSEVQQGRGLARDRISTVPEIWIQMWFPTSVRRSRDMRHSSRDSHSQVPFWVGSGRGVRLPPNSRLEAAHVPTSEGRSPRYRFLPGALRARDAAVALRQPHLGRERWRGRRGRPSRVRCRSLFAKLKLFPAREKVNTLDRLQLA